MTDRRRFYITTPIYYPNGEPHLGSVYTTLLCDVLARYHRLRGDDTFFLTGTDEHGMKMAKTAADAGGRAAGAGRPHTSRCSATLWQELGITNDDFIRTTEPTAQVGGAGDRPADCVATGDIYLGSYEGWYDEGQEEFVTETEAKANEYKSAISGKPLARYTEPTYFFRLSKYVPRVLEHIESQPGLHPARESRRNEVLSKLQAGGGGPVDQPGDAEVGHPDAQRPGARAVRVDRRADNYITALGLRQRTTMRCSSSSGRPTCT